MTTNKANSKNKFKMRSSSVFRCLLSVSFVLHQTSLDLLSEQGQVFVHATSDDEAVASTPSSRPKTGRIWRSGSGLKRSSTSEDGVLSAASGYPVQKYRTRSNCFYALQISIPRLNSMTNSISHAEQICNAIHTSTMQCFCSSYWKRGERRWEQWRRCHGGPTGENAKLSPQRSGGVSEWKKAAGVSGYSCFSRQDRAAPRGTLLCCASSVCTNMMHMIFVYFDFFKYTRASKFFSCLQMQD